MNVRMLKAKRVQQNLRQKDLAKALGITEKAMCHKECSEDNKFDIIDCSTFRVHTYILIPMYRLSVTAKARWRLFIHYAEPHDG